MNLAGQGTMLFWCIVDYGKGSRLLKLSRQLGSIGGIAFLGKGTINNDLFKILGIVETRREIFVTLVNEDMEEAFYEEVCKKFALDKPHHGIAFTMPLKYVMAEGEKKTSKLGERDVSGLDYEAIFVIADKGSMDDILAAAESAGSTGGTIIHGRGAGSKKKELLFNIEIEPEKDIILILSKAENTDTIVNAIKEKLKIHEPGAGIIFVMDVSRTAGLYEKGQ